MKRLSFEELKAQKSNAVTNLDAIRGGDASSCHTATPQPTIKGESIWEDAKRVAWAIFHCY